MSRPDLIVVGGGVAGWSLAYFAARDGADVLLLDAGLPAASRVPLALVNPVRGQGGRSSAVDRAGAAFTWELVAALRAAGHPVQAAPDPVLRPLPDAGTAERWAALPPEAGDFVPLPARVRESEHPWHSAYAVRDSGWVQGGSLLAALAAASGARVRRARAVALDAGGVTLAGGERLSARRVAHCAGAAGSALRGGGVHRGGSVWVYPEGALRLPGPLSYAVYAASAPGRDVLGSTFSPPSEHPDPHAPDPASWAWLRERAERLLGPGTPDGGVRWDGVRLSGLRAGGGGLRAHRAPDGVYELTGLGSKGFLLGPLLARSLWQEMKLL